LVVSRRCPHFGAYGEPIIVRRGFAPIQLRIRYLPQSGWRFDLPPILSGSGEAFRRVMCFIADGVDQTKDANLEILTTACHRQENNLIEERQ
jgi:hypothetical protein